MLLRGMLGQRITRALMNRKGISAMEYAVLGSISAVFILAVYSSIAGAIDRIMFEILN